MADGTQTEIAGMVCRHQGQVRGGEEEDERWPDPAQMGERVQQDGRLDGQTKGGDLDGNSGEPRRTLHKAKSVHLSFPFKAVELTNWSGTFGSHFLFLFGQWEGQEGLLKCDSMHAHSHMCGPLAQGHLPGDCLVEDTT